MFVNLLKKIYLFKYISSVVVPPLDVKTVLIQDVNNKPIYQWEP